MKRVNLKYDDVLSYENLDFVYRMLRKGVKNKEKLDKFDLYYSSNISHIYSLLKSRRYEVSSYHLFYVYKPKKRLIMSQEIGDKIVNHFVAYFYLIPLLEPCLIDSNVAVRKGMGTSYGVRLLKRYFGSLGSDFYILKCDIKSYFYSIDHDILKSLIKRKIKDKDILNLVFKIIDSVDSYGIRGLPIGNMTSQILGIYYLNGLDHYIKEVLNVKCYVRYMDDFLLLDRNKEYLKWCLDRINVYVDGLGLKLNYKTMLSNSRSGVNFLGYHFSYDKHVVIKPHNYNKRKIKRKMRLYKEGKISYNRVVCYKCYFSYCSQSKTFIV